MLSKTTIVMLHKTHENRLFTLPKLRENALFTTTSFPLSIHANHLRAILTNYCFDKMIIL